VSGAPGHRLHRLLSGEEPPLFHKFGKNEAIDYLMKQNKKKKKEKKRRKIKIRVTNEGRKKEREIIPCHFLRILEMGGNEGRERGRE